MKSERIFNFSAGPAVLPVSVLEQAQRELVSLPGVGMSILEVSHRSKVFEDVLARAEADIRQLARVPANYRVLFLQGGASLQFTMVPMNLLSEGTTADYLVTGAWSAKAVEERGSWARCMSLHDEAEHFSAPPAEEIAVTAGSALTSHESNNTIYGPVEDSGFGGFLVSDTSSTCSVHRRRSACADLSGLIRHGLRCDVVNPRGSPRAFPPVAARHVELRRTCRERVDVQHAARFRDLHARARDAMAD